MKNYIILPLILFLTIKTFSQEIKKEKITIYLSNESQRKGSIEIKEQEFQKINFYNEGSTILEEIPANQINQITDADGNEIYKSYQLKNKHFLMKLLISGDNNLYYFIDEKLVQHYISQSKKFGYKELIQTKTQKEIDSKNYTVLSSQYIGTMKVLFEDCPLKNLEKTAFNLKALSKAFEEYNTCRGNLTYKSFLQEKKPEIRLGIHVGTNFTTIETRYNSLVKDFNSQTGLTFGAEITYIPTFIESKITGTFGVFYTSKGGDAESLRENFESLEVDYQAIELSFSLRYHLFKIHKKIIPFLGIGLNKGFLINDLEERVVTIEENGNKKPFKNYAIADNSNTYNLTAQFEAGLNFLLNDNNGLILKGLYYNSGDKNEIFKAKGLSLQVGYLIRL